MKKIVTIFAVLILVGCVSYRPTPGSPVAERRAATFECSQEMMYDTQPAGSFGLIGGIIAAPARDRIMDDCMLRHGWTRD